jgi:hypothetical protein
MAAIEYRSYNAGTVDVEATSGNLQPASVTITVLHVPDAPVSASCGPAQSRACSGPREFLASRFGDRLALPPVPAGTKTSVSLFDLRGRLIASMVFPRTPPTIRHTKAQGVVVVRMSVAGRQAETPDE